jgi:urate oxidase
MALIGNTYGKGRVRIMRVHRDGDHNEVRELSLSTMVQGDFGRTYTHAGQFQGPVHDTMKTWSILSLTRARRSAKRRSAPQLPTACLPNTLRWQTAEVSAYETKWCRLAVDGRPHPHSFVLDANGKPFARITASRDA